MPFCEACGKKGADKRCSRCMASWYCCIECQTNHWKAGHKHKCVQVTEAIEATEATEATAPTEAGGAAAAPGAGTERAQRDVGDDDCAICLDVLVQPQTMPCGHRFCHGCVTSMQEYGARDTQVCPLCRSAMPDIERATWTACWLLTQWDRWLKSAPRGTPMPKWVLESVTKAAECCREALAIDPANERARYSLGCALDAVGDVAGAEIAYGATIADASPQTAAMAYCMLGVIRADRGDAAGAEAAFRAGAAADPQHAKAHANLGTQLIRRGDKAGAEAAYRAAIAADPQHANAHGNLGTILGDRGDVAGAARLFAAALQNDPSNANAKGGLQLALRMLKEERREA
jgi:Flp pilus assembly protein TadD